MLKFTAGLNFGMKKATSKDTGTCTTYWAAQAGQHSRQILFEEK
jgi:hypothetical protein